MSEESFSAPSLELLAALLPSYEFDAFIAQGGMGAVYKARQRSLDRDVAIKILPREFGEDAEFRASFETEAKAMAKLNHPNLIGVYDYGDVDGMPYIVMEFVNGKSLYHSAYQLAVDPEQAVTIVKGICDGLVHAHENGIIHRDIKPANILLTPKAEPKIGDFGLARPAGIDSSGLVMGTPGYTAPEVLSQPEQADRRSDLFSLGVVLYELLTGKCPPYDGQPPPPSTISRCDVSLDRICDRATHQVAALRYQNAGEMSSELDAWLKRAKHGGLNPHAHPSAHGVPHRHPHVAPARFVTPQKSRSGSAGLVTLAVVLIAGLIGWKWLGGKSGSTATGTPPTLAGADPAHSNGGEAKPTLPVPTPPQPEVVPDSPDPSDDPSMANHDSETLSPDSTADAGTDSPVPEVTNPDPVTPAGDPPSEVAELDSKARDLLKTLVADTGKEWSNNAKTLTWGLDGWLKGLPKSEQAVWTESVNQLKTGLQANRVPMSLEQTNLVLSDKMSALCQQCAEKQKTIDETYRGKADRIRSSYVTRMKDIAEKLKSGGDVNGAAHADSLVNAAAELNPWLDTMGAPAFEAGPVGDFSAGDVIVGSWRSLNTGGRQIVFMRDGTCRSPQDRGTWRREDGSGKGYEILWSDGKWMDQLTIGQNRNRITGTNQKNQRISLVREDSVPLGQIQEGAGEISGWWKWLGMDNNIVEIRKDGTAFAYSNSTSAKWEAKGNRGSRVFSITWTEGQYKGYVNVVRVTDGGKRLADTGEGAKLHAERGADVPR